VRSGLPAREIGGAVVLRHGTLFLFLFLFLTIRSRHDD